MSCRPENNGLFDALVHDGVLPAASAALAARRQGLFVTWRLHRPCSEPYLARPEIARMVADALAHEDGWDVLAWVIMPEHVHVLIHTARALAEVTKSIKTFTARRANLTLGRAGSF